MRPIRLPGPPDDYDQNDETQNRHALEIYLTQLSADISNAPATTGPTDQDGLSLYKQYTVLNVPFSADYTDTKGHGLTKAFAAGPTIDTTTNPPCARYTALQQDLTGVNCQFGDNDWTIEGWFSTTSNVQFCTLISKTFNTIANLSEWTVIINNTAPVGVGDGRIALYSAKSGQTCLATSGKVNDGVRHHLRVCRASTDFYIFIDGLVVGHTQYVSDDAWPQLATGVDLGGDYQNLSRGFIGTLDNWRVLIGIALSRFNFTVPTPPFPTS